MHDSEHVGERIPFYNTPVDENEDNAAVDEEGKKGIKKVKKLAFPNVKYYV